LREAVKALFKDAAKAVMRRDENEKPEPRRSKSGDTEKGFGMAARALLRRVAGIPTEAYAAAAGYLFGTLD
jgi:hypothetical protein